MNREQISEMIEKASALELELVWIPKIVGNQTSSEVMSETTIEENGVGLNGRDAGFVTSVYHQIQSGKSLSQKQIEAVKRVLPKYWKQYISMMNS